MLARQDFAEFDCWLIERINAEEPARENRFQHKVHEHRAHRLFVQRRHVEDAHRAASLHQRFGHSMRLGSDQIADCFTGQNIDPGDGCQIGIDTRAGLPPSAGGRRSDNARAGHP